MSTSRGREATLPPEHLGGGRYRGLAKQAFDGGLLLLRISAAALIWWFHMRPKLGHFSRELEEFPDPLRLGHAPSFVLALASEGLCSILVAIGLLTRLACVPIVFTMGMVLLLAIQGFEGADVQASLLYALPYGALALLGPGRWSLDHLLRARYQAVIARFLERRAR